MKKRVLSGMRPTGLLHLGHLVGALDNWVKLQEEYDCYFMVADWHALMSEYVRPQDLARYALENVIDWLSAGVSDKKSTIFIQSQVDAHLQLHFIFSCFVPLGWLERCPTYKEQLRQITTRDINTYGFLGYPVLQAADILLYRAEYVPVGEDQLPHIELTREIARRFHALYKKEVFPYPEALLTNVPRLMGTDGRKMSKSYNNTINLSDSRDTIVKKISLMITDPKRIKLSDKGHPDVCNVFSYYAVFLPSMTGEVRQWCENATLGCTACKRKLAEALLGYLEPLQKRRRMFAQHISEIKRILAEGREKANEQAFATLRQVKKAMGYEL